MVTPIWALAASMARSAAATSGRRSSRRRGHSGRGDRHRACRALRARSRSPPAACRRAPRWRARAARACTPTLIACDLRALELRLGGDDIGLGDDAGLVLVLRDRGASAGRPRRFRRGAASSRRPRAARRSRSRASPCAESRAAARSASLAWALATSLSTVRRILPQMSGAQVAVAAALKLLNGMRGLDGSTCSSRRSSWYPCPSRCRFPCRCLSCPLPVPPVVVVLLPLIVEPRPLLRVACPLTLTVGKSSARAWLTMASASRNWASEAFSVWLEMSICFSSSSSTDRRRPTTSSCRSPLPAAPPASSLRPP